MKISIDLDKSLKLCPPNYPKGVNFQKRLILNRDKVKFNKQHQTYRVEVNLRPHINALKDSYTVNDFIYTEKPQVIKIDPNNPKFYIGVVGHNRDEAQEELGWQTSIYDVVTFDSPLDELKFAYKSNQHNPAAGSKYEDILKGLSKAHDTNMIDLTDDDNLKKLIANVASNFTAAQQKTIFKKFRDTKSKYESIQPYDGPSANEKANELSLPILGDGNYEEVGEYGFVKEPGGYKTLLHDGLKLWLRENASDPIKVTGYVKNPNPTNIVEKRMSWKKELDKMKSFMFQVCSQLTGMKVEEIEKRNKWPFVYNGFLPQNLTPDTSNGGLPMETGLVDVNGEEFES